MGLFDNIREEILEEFDSYVADVKYDTKYEHNCFNNRYFIPAKVINNRLHELVLKLEIKRWGYSAICPKCNCDKCYELNDNKSFKCGNSECYSQFTVFTNTILANTNIEINKWYDLIVAYRQDNKLSSHKFCKVIGTTQKTTWWMLTKIKTNSLVLEADMPVLHILLTPFTFTQHSYISKKPTFKEYEKKCLKSISEKYLPGSVEFNVLKNILFLIKSDYDCSITAFCKKFEMPKTIYRYLNGERSLPEITAYSLQNLIQEQFLLQYEKLIDAQKN